MNLRHTISILILTIVCVLTLNSLSATATGPSGYTTYLPWIEPAYIPPSTLDIIYTGQEDGNLDLFLIRADGTNLRRVTNDPSNESEPAVSYDGSRYVFVSDRNGNPELYSLVLATNTVERLTNHPANDKFPTYSPNDEKIAFISTRESTTDTFPYHIYIANFDGSNPIRLSDTPSTSYSWSPDGTKISFVESNSTRIHIVDLGGGASLIIEPDLSAYPLPRVFNVNWSGTGEELIFGWSYQPSVPQASVILTGKIRADGSTTTATLSSSCGMPLSAFDHPYILCPHNMVVSDEERGYFIVANSRPRTEVLRYGSTATVYRDPRWVP